MLSAVKVTLIGFSTFKLPASAKYLL